ncbi:MAG: type IVB secretion system lipoprotein DotD [Gammaproteobacteria bacterium]|jgi:defect-in-organelle-trafficking protein DotD
MKKIFNTFILTAVIIASFINCGCSKLKNKANKQKNSINNTKNNVDTDIGSQLVSSARSIEKSLAILAASQEINNIPVLNTIPLITQEGGMGGTADIDWTGPLEPLLEKLANMTDYTLKIMGSTPSIPIIVSVTQEKAIIADILKNACLQAGKRTNIVVFPASKIIELRYRFAQLGPSTNPSKK